MAGPKRTWSRLAGEVAAALVLVVALAWAGLGGLAGNPDSDAGTDAPAAAAASAAAAAGASDGDAPAASAPSADSAPDAASPNPAATSAPAASPAATLTFRNERLRDEHYRKHGIDMGFSSAQEYERAAANVVANPDALHKLQAEDGDDVYYLEDTDEFVVVSPKGFIRTYFQPGGKDYYDRQ